MKKTDNFRIRHYDNNVDETCLVRDNLSIKLYFQYSNEKVTKDVNSLFNSWLEIIPKEQLSYFVPGPNADVISPKKVNPKTVSLLNKKLSLSKRDIYIHIYGKDRVCPDFSFEARLNQNLENDETNYVEIFFPTDFLNEFGKDNFIFFVNKIAEDIEFDTGYVGISINTAPYGYGNWNYEKSFGIAAVELEKYHFLKLIDDSIYLEIGMKCLNPHWINLYGSRIVKKLGGSEVFTKLSSSDIVVNNTKKYISVHLGEDPFGDISLYKNLANVLKENLFLNHDFYSEYFQYSPEGEDSFEDAEDKAKKWINRFTN